MALNRKKSRPITVDEQRYRYVISTTKVGDHGHFRLNLTVQLDQTQATALCVQGLITRDFWFDLPDGPQWCPDNYPVITPNHVASIIRKAQGHGWQANIAGKPMLIRTNNKAFFSHQ